MGQNLSISSCADCRAECTAPPVITVSKNDFKGTHDEWEVENFIQSFNCPKNGETGWASWGFNIFDLSIDTLTPLSQAILSSFSIPTKFNMPPMKLRRFLLGCRELMLRHNVSYHNYYHAVDVLQAAAVFVQQYRASMYLDDLEVAALLLGALCHDLDHPGLNNDYHIRRRLPLALRYNDTAVLENHHAAKMVELLEDVRMSIMENAEEWQSQRFRQLATAAILATDMGVHFTLLEQFEACLAEGGAGGPRAATTEGALLAAGFDPDRGVDLGGLGSALAAQPAFVSAEERALLVKVLLHAVDISNPARPWAVAQRWNDLITEEFFRQGDRERAEGLAVSPNMDRAAADVPSSTLGFVDFIVAPLFAAVARALPAAAPCLLQLGDNRGAVDRARAARAREERSAERGKWEQRAKDFEEVLRGAAAVAAF
mmetsp:Transcript_7866/g.10994  ORF Transcript_7866/g.10994 Transcript_7866/m.10994 type:complete len:429 (-) Transcript_7866:496-1782(-)